MNKVSNKDYIDHPKTKVYDLLSESFTNNYENCCHYTSTLVLDLLLKNATFRATHLFYLNDSSELINGINQLKKIFEKSKFKKPLQLLNSIQYSESKRKIGLYSISFSEDSDLLHQWITYAKESGVCLVLDGNLFNNVVLRTIPESDENKKAREKLLKGEIIDNPISILNNIGVAHRASKIIYKMKYDGELNAEKIYNAFAMLDEEDECVPAKNIVEQKWNEAIAINGGDAKLYLLLLASLLKNNDFESEKEIRAIFLAEQEGQQKMNIKYFPLPNGVLRPFCEICFCSEEEKPLLPLKEIVIGPSGNQQAVFDSVVHRIKYGETNLWDYWSMVDTKAFEENFYKYVLGALNRYVNDTGNRILKSMCRKIFGRLKATWEMENDRKIAFCTWKKCLGKNTTLEDNYQFKFNKKSGEKSEELEAICNKIEQDNYFSCDGIWIKKSQIPYIF